MDKNIIKRRIRDSVIEQHSDAKVILFGSKARGTDTIESDWDILVLLNKPLVTFKDEQKIRHKLYEIELEMEEPISTFVYSLNDWNSRMSVTPLYKNVKKDGIQL